MNPQTLKLIEQARARHAERLASQAMAQQAVSSPIAQAPVNMVLSQTENLKQTSKTTFNDRQLEAIELALQAKSINLIGAAGTGKTTVTQEIIARLQQSSHMRPLTEPTKHLAKDAPGIVICGYTNKAVNNIRKKLPPHLQAHCITIHKLLEYEPFYYEIIDDEGAPRTTMRFEPSRNGMNPLPHISTIIFEESSMIGTDLFGEVVNALPRPGATQMIFLGDLNQLKPVFGDSILGFKLAEMRTVELTHVYRQALASPIIALATAIRSEFQTMPEDTHGAYSLLKQAAAGKLVDKQQIDCGQDGILTVHPYKKRTASQTALATMGLFVPQLIDSGAYNPAEDMILCPFNKAFGTLELNRIIANHLAKKENKIVWEVIARYQRTYWAEGDRVLVDRHEATIIKIEKTIGYGGKLPRPESASMDHWGNDPLNTESAPVQMTADQVLNELDRLGGANNADEEAKNLASHTITVYIPDLDREKKLTTAGEINSMLFSWALTVHKSQGSEWQRVFLFIHDSHSVMISRELVYTAVTRAKHELYMLCEGDTGGKQNTILRAAKRPDIPGTTLPEKIRYFSEKAKQMRNTAQSSMSDDN